ncbi:MAG: response regulator [Gammaproteobacteria bacterium]|nr:response regulator [Gammaproteobacteria bacterium]NNM20672.1 response regulator [Gammaproteobacteria bacterium]
MLPGEVSAYLERLEQDQIPPLMLQLDATLKLLEVRGEPSRMGLPPLVAGADVSDVLPMLSGLESAPDSFLGCVDPGTGHAVNVRLFRSGDDQLYAVLTSAEAQRRQIEQLQQRANETRLLNQQQQKLLDQLIATRTELDLRRREAEEAVRVKAQFLASISHEFRTPLTSVIGYAEWLASAMGEDDPARRQARAIISAGRHMVTLVDNILEQARIENAEATVHEDTVDLRQLAEDLSAIMAPLAADKELAFAAFVDPPDVQPVVLDEMRVRQILINLLGNAVKFTEEGFVYLTLAWQDGQLHAEVSDSGPGIAEADRARIFTAFERLEGAHKRAGAGLGLHITLELVKLLGGSLGLDSQPGEGSRFLIRLPAPVAAAPEPDAAGGGGGRLLVAEDDPDIVQLMQLFLERAGYELEFVGNGRDAVTRIAAGSIDLAILDLNMPILDGLSAIKQIRDGGYSGPAIALTGATLDEDRIRAIEAGFDGFVAKPVRMPELIGLLRDLIK